MYDITDEVTVRLGLGQRALEDSREQAIRGLIVCTVPSNLRCLGPRTESLALSPLSHFCLPVKRLSHYAFVFQQLCFVLSCCSDHSGHFQHFSLIQPGIDNQVTVQDVERFANLEATVLGSSVRATHTLSSQHH